MCSSEDRKNTTIKQLERKYKFVENFSDFTEVSDDLKKINSIDLKSENKDNVNRCEKLKKLMIDIAESLKTKLERV